MEIAKSQIVVSLAGRDKGRLFIVVDIEPDFVYLSDGRLRNIEKPKKKKLKHIAFVSNNDNRVAEKVINGEKVLNSEIRRALSQFAQDTNSTSAASSTGR